MKNCFLTNTLTQLQNTFSRLVQVTEKRITFALARNNLVKCRDLTIIKIRNYGGVQKRFAFYICFNDVCNDFYV